MKSFSVLFIVSCCLFACAPNPGSDTRLQSTNSLPAAKPDYLDTSLDLDSRLDDLLSRMTLEEKVSQMINSAPAIERLNIPAYDWWNEGLHGVARAGLATSFPQAIGMAAMWDEQQLFKVATAISDEARAKHHDFARKGKHGRYQGLTLWSPNINIVRDPRWGRGQETYGEDPYLTGKLAVRFIKGLQGDDPHYFKTIATVKHFAVHNGPEPERHEFNAIANQRDLLETYLPQFEMTIKDGNAQALMCAYNRINGQAACGDAELLNDTLRQQWHFTGHVVSDCGAIADFHEHHKVTQTPEQSAALAVKSGTDLNCGFANVVFPHLTEAVKQGLLTENDIDRSVRRLFKARMQLGMFDPDEDVAYSQIPYSTVDSQAHRQLALETAQKSIVLLKNEHQTLPLKKDLKTLAVIGPNADQWLTLLGNYYGSPADPITPLRGIRQAVSANTKVLFAQGSQLASGVAMFYPIPQTVLRDTDNQPGLMAEYFHGQEFTASPLYAEHVQNVDINWRDQAPRSDMDDDNFAVRWTGTLVPEQSGEYQLGVISTMYSRVYINDQLVVKTDYNYRNEYGDPRLKKADTMQFIAGQSYDIRVESIESYSDAQVQLVWATPQTDLQQQALDIAKQADAVVMVMGLSANMEGEEMDIQIDGFRGGDRTKLALPEVQQQLIQKVQALGKPVVLVLLNGSALALNWENANVPAIVEAWYPGQAAGTAIASVLFGDYNPAGRLPVTFYHSVDELPAFEDYQLTTQTYRYFDKTPLYPFGYGLSYSRFNYSDLAMPDVVNKGDKLNFTVNVSNTSDVDGDEVAQVYVAKTPYEKPYPRRSLKSFQRLHLKAGETRQLHFELPEKAFALANEDGMQVLSGDYQISVGGGQPVAIEASSNVISQTIKLH